MCKSNVDSLATYFSENDAAKDVEERINTESNGMALTLDIASLKPLRFEK
jgi:hypothetical protein